MCEKKKDVCCSQVLQVTISFEYFCNEMFCSLRRRIKHISLIQQKKKISQANLGKQTTKKLLEFV